MNLKHLFIVSFLLLSLSSFSQKQLVFSGIITDSHSGKTLEGIDILVKDNLTGTISSNSGEYQLYLQDGKYQIVISGDGYKEKTLNINLNDNQFVKIKLEAENKIDKKRQTNKQSLYPSIREQVNTTENFHI